ncbi:hypothetical protein O6H91_Y475900 [Diphasiastrum complanatum]|nr:hypothetical protein O6H91_Y475900 [Diphasiastrum complanatum]
MFYQKNTTRKGQIMGVSKFLDSSGLNSIAAAACIFNKHHFSLSDSPHAHTGARTHTHAHSRSRKQEEGELRYNNKEQEMEEVAAGDSRAAINSATLRAILQQARNFLDEGKPSLALQAVSQFFTAQGLSSRWSQKWVFLGCSMWSCGTHFQIGFVDIVEALYFRPDCILRDCVLSVMGKNPHPFSLQGQN